MLTVLRCTALQPVGARAPISALTAAPQSPPCATHRSYPSRLMSVAQASAMRSIPHPGEVGLSEKP